MKLLFDQNLSHKLAKLFVGQFPGSAAARDLGLASASDSHIWAYAKQNGYVLVSKDSDFRQRSFVLGPPPKVIWIATGNCSTQQIIELLNRSSRRIQRFDADASEALLVLM